MSSKKPNPQQQPQPQQQQQQQQASSSTSTEKTVLGKYVLGSLLGTGRFAKVYKARSLLDNRSVAIKIIDKHKTDPSIHPRIVSEVSAMARLDHPNVLRIQEVMASKHNIYLVVELATGGELSVTQSRRHDHRFPEQIARRYFHQIVSALHYCHLNGVAHRDIKPQNVLLDEEGNVKVSDFGLAAIVEGPLDTEHLLKTTCGTPAFAAPEIVGRTRLRVGYDGSKADSWSCGVMLFVMLTGHLPFDDTSLALMYRKMIKKEFRLSSWMSKPARSLITRLLDPNPETRLGFEEILKDTWLKNQGMVYPRSISLGDLASLAENETKKEKKSTMRERTASMNAFEIISMSSGLNLSGLFESDDLIGKRGSSRFAPKGVVFTVEEEG